MCRPALEMGTYIDTSLCAAQTVLMMGMRVPGTEPSGDRLYRCTVPRCKQIAMSDYPPNCDIHDIPMEEVLEEDRPKKGKRKG